MGISVTGKHKKSWKQKNIALGRSRIDRTTSTGQSQGNKQNWNDRLQINHPLFSR